MVVSAIASTPQDTWESADEWFVR
ncbi:hypothetical protein [Escherichia coli]